MKQLTYKLVTLADVASAIDKSLPLMVDTETIGLYGKIRLVQFYQGTEAFQQGDVPVAYLVEYPNIYELLQLMETVETVGYNFHYDISCIQAAIGNISWVPSKFQDAFLASRLYFYTRDEFSMDKVISYMVGHNPYGTTKSEMHKADWSVPVLSEEQKMYGAADVIYLWDLWTLIGPTSLEDINYQLDLITLRNCLDMQCNGLPIDMDILEEQYKENAQRIKDIGLTINVNSWKQVRPYIGSEMSDDNGLAYLSANGNERATQVREVRKLTKQNSFLTKFQNTVRNGCLFGKFKPSARSGRLTSDDQNLQQLPRKLKKLFGVTEEGDEIILFSDFAQIQLRGVCVITADKTMEALFRANEDLHNYVARFIFGDDFTPEHRQISKTANFSLLFGAGIEVFKAVLLKDAGMLLSDAKASEIKKAWLKLWKEIAAWQNLGIKDWKNGKAWETPLGRRYVSKMMTDQLAMQIQGFEAEVAKLAWHYMKPRLAELDKRILLRNFVHDSYLFTCPNNKDTYEKACFIIADAMQEAWREMCQSVTIKDLPMPVKVRAGWNWGDIEKGTFVYELNKA